VARVETLVSRRSEALRCQHLAGAGGPRSCSVTESNSAGRRGAGACAAVAEIAEADVIGVQVFWRLVAGQLWTCKRLRARGGQ
jgi:hypothetical protein